MTDNGKFRIIVITTGGTIDKIYDESDGSLENKGTSVKQMILSKLRMPYTDIEVNTIFSKDSLFMNDSDRELLANFINYQFTQKCPILILHGTDTMTVSAEYCLNKLGPPPVPVVFTGAMRPMVFADSDAQQNVTEALLACKLLSPGYYISFHNRIFPAPKVRKNKEKSTFEAI